MKPRRMSRSSESAIALAAVMIMALAACQPERVEYHRRPAFYERASQQKLPDELVMEDGTVIKYITDSRPGIVGRNGEDGTKPFQTREEKNGEVTLHALLPEHVLENALTCLRDQEYQLLYDKLLAQRKRDEYAQAGQGFAEFEAFCRKNRHELAATLTRMLTGIASMEVSFTDLGQGVTRCRMRSQIAGPFRFRMVDVVKENQELKLLMIQ